MSYFPMFIDLKENPCLIIGGGKAAERKVQVLKDFGARITVVFPVISDRILRIEDICCVCREFYETDLEGMTLVVAAADDKEQNHRIAEMCKRRGILVNAVDQMEDCSFIFPAYLKQGEVVAAFSSGGQSPVLTQYLKRETAPFMSPMLGELAEYLGSLREMVKHTVKTENLRKQFYQEVLTLGIAAGKTPQDMQVQEILKKYQEEE